MPRQPRTAFDAPTVEFDFPGLFVGIAEYEEGPTGCTVFRFEPRAAFVADIRGGAPGTVNADVGSADAICFAGGSLLGLEAAAGVASGLFARRGHEHVEWTDVPLVAGAIIFDFGWRPNGIYPDAALGRAALDAARPGVFPVGRRGAARYATVGKAISFDMVEPGAQGAASRTVGPVRLAAFTVLNALGAVHDRSGNVVRGNRRADGSRVPYDYDEHRPPRPGNTTLTLLVTDLEIDGRRLGHAARQAHASMARAIRPFHTEVDGDVLFFATTNRVTHERLLAPGALGTVAGELAWDAALAAFRGE